MNLSDAIRAGCKMKPQAFGQVKTAEGTCVIGAACEGIGLDLLKIDAYRELVQNWPFIDTLIRHPIKGHVDTISHTVWELNDENGWSREAIAEWVETEEKRLGVWEDLQRETETIEANTEGVEVDTYGEKEELHHGCKGVSPCLK